MEENKTGQTVEQKGISVSYFGCQSVFVALLSPGMGLTHRYDCVHGN